MASVSTRPSRAGSTRGGSYGGEEGIFGDVREQRACTRAAAGGDVLCQLVLRRVGFHELDSSAGVHEIDLQGTLPYCRPSYAGACPTPHAHSPQAYGSVQLSERWLAALQARG